MLTGALPAAAAPVRQSGSSSFLYSETTGQCTSTGRCTEIFLEAFTGTMEPGQVCLSTSTYQRTSGGGRTALTDEHGCADLSGAALTVTDDLSATLQPTTLTLEAFSCEGEEDEAQCSVTSRRDVTVSSSQSAVGPITSSRDRGRSTTGQCRSTYRSTTTSAPVAGTVTVDGTTHTGEGQAGTTSFRSTSRKCSLP